MNENKNAQPEAEQLLKLLDIQLAAARDRRNATGSKRSSAGMIGLAVIVAGAAFALWILMTMLDQMRPQQRENPAGPVPAEVK